VNPTLARHCQRCKQYHQIPIQENLLIMCPNCQTQWGKIETEENIFDFCPICRCRQFYLSKDFNQFIGCLIMAIGIILVPFTYGLSLPFFALIDWMIYKRIPTIANCYQCGTEFRNFPNIKQFKPFMHHIGLKYDKTRNTR